MVSVVKKEVESPIHAASLSEATRFTGRPRDGLFALDLLDVGADSIPRGVQFIPDIAMIWIIFRKYSVCTVLTPII